MCVLKESILNDLALLTREHFVHVYGFIGYSLGLQELLGLLKLWARLGGPHGHVAGLKLGEHICTNSSLHPLRFLRKSARQVHRHGTLG